LLDDDAVLDDTDPRKPFLVYKHTQSKETYMTAKTMSVPEAGREYYGLSRNAAYAAAKRKEIPTIKIGKLLRVPVRALEEKLNETMKADAA
jgi:hypothetical protein